MIAIILGILLSILGMGSAETEKVVVIPPMPQYSPEMIEAADWAMYWHEAYEEYEDEFTALFNSYDVKRAKNGAMMIRQGNSGSFKFCKKG